MIIAGGLSFLRPPKGGISIQGLGVINRRGEGVHSTLRNRTPETSESVLGLGYIVYMKTKERT